MGISDKNSRLDDDELDQEGQAAPEVVRDANGNILPHKTQYKSGTRLRPPIPAELVAPQPTPLPRRAPSGAKTRGIFKFDPTSGKLERLSSELSGFNVFNSEVDQSQGDIDVDLSDFYADLPRESSGDPLISVSLRDAVDSSENDEVVDSGITSIARGSRQALSDVGGYMVSDCTTERPFAADFGSDLEAEYPQFDDEDITSVKPLLKEVALDQSDSVPPADLVAQSLAYFAIQAMGEVNIIQDEGAYRRRVTIPDVPSVINRIDLGSYEKYIAAIEKYYPQFLKKWWVSESPVERLWGQFHCTVQIFTSESIEADLKKVFGEHAIKVNHQSMMAGLDLVHDNIGLLKAKMRKLYPPELLNAIVEGSAKESEEI